MALNTRHFKHPDQHRMRETQHMQAAMLASNSCHQCTKCCSAGRYKYQLAVDEKQDMSSSVHSLMLLRDWLKDGRAGLVPGMSVFDEGNNLWLPLQQVTNLCGM